MSDGRLPSVSVIVATRNAADTLGECLDSLLALDYPRDRVEVVVVDNGSRDRTRRLLARYGNEIVVVDEPRRGVSPARNAGIRRSRRDVIAFTDADCTVHTDWLRRLVEPLESPGVGIAGGRILAREGASAAERFGDVVHDQRAAILVWKPPYVISMNWASRRAVLEELSMFDESLRRVEDVDLSWRIGRAGYSLVYCPEAIVWHRNESNALGLAREGWQHGFYAVPVLARHADYVVEALAEPAQALRPEPRNELPARYRRAFETGKRVGRACGRGWLRLSS
jgi:cellulose synthase/poly-beta-1,6-N-acetylglucosamine synthase-like glycosyltransferase